MEQIEKNILRYNDALVKSIQSIIADDTQDTDSKLQYLNKSLEQYTTAIKGIFLEPPQKPIKKTNPNIEQIIEIEKFNPYHDRLGRFATAGAATSFTYKPGQGKMYDNAIAREKERQAALEAERSKPKQNLVKGLGKEHAEAVEKLVQDSSDADVKAVWNKYGEEISVNNAKSSRAYCSYDGSINVNIANDSKGGTYKPPYETTLHESGHSIDHAISRKVGYRFSERYNGGEFQDTLVKEGTQYIKNFQSKLSAERGEKVSIGVARSELGKLMRKEGAITTGDVSDMLEGVTKGKFEGSAGHGTSYWIGRQSPVGRIGAHNVCVEAFAEMFSASTTNPKSLAKIKEVFPESYKVFQKMMKEATTL